MAKLLNLFLMIQLFAQQCSGTCRKMLVIPGVATLKIEVLPFIEIVKKERPCTKPEVFLYKEGLSVASVTEQIEGLRPKFLEYMRDNPQGLILVGGSLGGVVSRGLIETTSNHTVHSLFTFSSPHQGVFDLPYIGYATQVVRNKFVLQSYTTLFYKPEMQDLFSVASAWKDPTQYDLYLEKNKYLPYLNNEKPHNMAAMYKTNLLRLKKMVVLSGDKDEAVYPWQSGLWDYFDTNGQYPKMVNMTDQEIYKNDTLGLKTMYEDGRLIRCTVFGANHVSILFDARGLNNCFFPYIDKN